MQSAQNYKLEEWRVDPEDAISRRTQVVIVGAGLAGLAAAQRLFELGIRDVLVLEAQNRVGGRVHTINHCDHIIELGAQWLHGANDNPLYKWLTDKNMLEHFEGASMGFDGSFSSDNGGSMDRKLVEEVLDILVGIKMALFKDDFVREMVNNNNHHHHHESAGGVFRRLLELELEKKQELETKKAEVWAIFDWFLKYETIENGCDSMDDVSIASYTDWTDLGNGTLLNFKHGYGSLLQWFCSQIPAKKWLQHNQRVSSIEMLTAGLNGNWLDQEGNQYTSPVLVRTMSSQNKGMPRLIGCEQVIVTVSLGVLKRTHATLFRPPLPETKRALIETIGFGTVNKIVLQFEKPFWGKEHGIKLVWNESHRKNGYFPEWAFDIVAFDVVRRQKNLLIGWIGGHGSKLIEKEDDAQIGLVCLRILESFLPEASKRPTRLLSCVCSRWFSNQDTCGSYSFQSVQSYGLNVDRLHEPLYNVDQDRRSSFSGNACNRLAESSISRVPRIMFAGEATAGKLYSTTHGAILSGWREADRILDHPIGNKATNCPSAIRVQECAQVPSLV